MNQKADSPVGFRGLRPGHFWLALAERLVRLWWRSQERLHSLLEFGVFRRIGFCHEEIDAAKANHGTTMVDEAQSTPEPGEVFSPQLTFKWITTHRTEEGEAIAPAKIATSAGREFAALSMILTDLSFALECLTEADRIGIPNATDLHIKTLIFSGVVSYARPFMSSVRAIKLTPDTFAEVTFNAEIHEYLMALRNKHVSHSVNEFESCEAIAIMVRPPGLDWRDGGAIGVVEARMIGLSRTMVRHAIDHITGAINFLSITIEKRRIELYNEFKTQFAQNGKWEMAPLVRIPHRSNIANRRPK